MCNCNAFPVEPIKHEHFSHLFLDCLQEAHSHSGPPPQSQVMKTPEAHPTCCPFVTCTRCPLDVGVASDSPREKTPRSSPSPPLCRSPLSFPTWSASSSGGSATATWPAITTSSALVMCKNKRGKYTTMMVATAVFCSPALSCQCRASLAGIQPHLRN